MCVCPQVTMSFSGVSLFNDASDPFTSSTGRQTVSWATAAGLQPSGDVQKETSSRSALENLNMFAGVGKKREEGEGGVQV